MNNNVMNTEAVLDRFFTTCGYSELYKAIWRQTGLTLDDVLDNLNNSMILDANNGFASGFIYYKDTIRFAEKHLVDALKLFNHYEFGGNELSKMLYTDNDIDFNKVSFFLYESFIIDFVEYLQELKRSNKI